MAENGYLSRLKKWGAAHKSAQPNIIFDISKQKFELYKLKAISGFI
jgi:hypothetical protein